MSGTGLTSDPSHSTNFASAVPGPQSVAGRKRKRYYEESSEKEDEDAEIDSESYDQSVPQEMEEVVDDFISKTFRCCVHKRKRFELARNTPSPVPLQLWCLHSTMGSG